MGRNRTSFAPGNRAARKSGARSPRAIKRQASLEARRLRGWVGDVPLGKQPLLALAAVYAGKVSLYARWVLDNGGYGSTKCESQSREQDDAARILIGLLDRLGSDRPDDLEGLLRGKQ